MQYSQGTSHAAQLLIAHAFLQADGHCLYRAVEDQLAAPQAAVGPHDAAEPSQDGDHAQPAGDYRALRHAAAHWMRGHPDHFLPFISQVSGHA